MVKTSQTHPLVVGWLPRLRWCSEEARAGITFMPGKVGLALDGGRWARDLAEDLAVIRQDASVLVVLATREELEEAGVGNLLEVVPRFDLTCVHIEVAKGGCFDGAYRPAALDALKQLRRGIARGRGAVVVSPSGLDRAVAFAVSAMIASGMSPMTAIKAARTARSSRALENALQAADAVALAQEYASAETRREAARIRECLLPAPPFVAAAFQTLSDLHARQPDGRQGLPVTMPTYGRLSTATDQVAESLATFRTTLLNRPAHPERKSEEDPEALARLAAIYHLCSVVQLLQVMFSSDSTSSWISPENDPPEWQRVRAQLDPQEDEGDLQGRLSPPVVPNADWRPRANLSRGAAHWFSQGIGPLTDWSTRQVLEGVGAKLEALAIIGAYIGDLARRLRGLNPDQDEPIATAEDFGQVLASFANRRAGQVWLVLQNQT